MVRSQSFTLVAGSVTTSKPVNGQSAINATAASAAMMGSPEGLNAGRLAGDPKVKPSPMIATRGMIFSTVSAICAALISFKPRILMSVNTPINARALNACPTGLSFSAGTNTVR